MTCLRPAFLFLIAAIAVHAATVPAGAELEIRLKTRVASNVSKPKDPVEAVLIRPVLTGGGVALPAGTVIRGTVKEAVPIKGPDDRPALELAFMTAEPPGEKPLAIPARLALVDNARESVTETGRIVGILASETLAGKIDAGVGRVGRRNSGLGDFLGTVRSVVLKDPEPEIDYEPGVEMTLALTTPLETPPATAPAAVKPLEPAEALYALANALPFRTTTEGAGVPSDLTNLMFVGTAEQVEAAFAAAGWSTAAQLNAASGLEVFRAVAEMRGYKEAPMSILLLDGRKPDLVFQKQNNTFAMRHHLRIWRRSETFRGLPVWMCAATHDIGIEFSPEQRTFIHKIDSDIDRERAKVVSDLLFTGRVTALSLVARPKAPAKAQNATGDDLNTDGAIAVVEID